MPKRIAFLILTLIFLSLPSQAFELRDTRLNLLFGFTPTEGVLGIEFQNRHHAIALGMPNSYSYKYFFNADENSQFVGAFYNTLDDNKTKESIDGFQFDRSDHEDAGLAYGYRWRWQSGWNISVMGSTSVRTEELRQTNGTATGEKTAVVIGFGFNGGYRF